MTGPHISRRSALVAGAGALGAVGLAACHGGGGAATATEQPKTGQQVAKVSDIEVGKAISASAGGKPVIVSRPSADQVACFSAICTHQGCTVQPQGDQAVCPCHGSVYNALTGKVINPPAPSPLVKIPVTVQNGEIVTS